MSDLISLLSFRDSAKKVADMVDNPFVPDSEWNIYINSACTALYDILTGKFEDYYTKAPVQFTISSGQIYSLPADFYKLRGLDKSDGETPGGWCELKRTVFTEKYRRNHSINRSMLGRMNQTYSIIGNTLYIWPADQASGTYQLWYIPKMTRLVNDVDTFDVVNGWDEFVYIDAAMQALGKDETDISHLERRKLGVMKRIEDMAANRDAGQPEKIGDTQQTIFDIDYPFMR